MEKSNSSLKATLLSSLGAGFEYYDFIIYGMMAEFLSTLFFPSDEPWIGTLKAFAIFAVGYVVRPFGGIFFGMAADTFGRKQVFILVMLLMAIATFSIGLLPTHQHIGGIASLLLVFLRVLQGLSFGAELPGAITVACEYSEKNKRGGNSGIVIASTSIGAMVASFILFVLSGVMTKGQILNWGWRIPLLLGGILAVANYFIRKHLQETPEFVQAQKLRPCKKDIKEPFVCLLKQFKKEIFQGIGMTVFLSSLVIQVIYFPTYLSAHFGYSSSDIYLTMLCSMIWSALTLPLCGLLADRIGKKLLFRNTALAYMIGVFPLFSLLELHTFSCLLLFMCLYQTVISFVSVCYFPLLVDIFPTNVRYTGVAACYNISYSLMATLPLLSTTLIRYSGTPWSLVWIALACAFITCMSLVSREPDSNPVFQTT